MSPRLKSDRITNNDLVDREHNCIQKNTNTQSEIFDKKENQLGSKNIKSVSLKFHEKHLEKSFKSMKDEMFKTNFLTTFVLYSFLTVQQFFIPYAMIWTNFLIFAVGLSIFFVLFLFIVPVNFIRLQCYIKKYKKIIDKSIRFREVLMYLSFVLILCTSILPLILCDTNDDNPVQIQTNCTQFNNSQSRTFFNSICDQPTYIFINGLMVLFSCITYRLNHLIKLMLLVTTCTAISIIAFFTHNNVFANYFILTCRSSKTQAELLLNTAILWVSAICVYYQGRRLEYNNRLDFLRKKQAAEEKNELMNIRTNNQLLLRNIMPEHVTHHFLGTKKDHEELYSCAHNCVGVIFASIPNFDDCKLMNSKAHDLSDNITSDYARFSLRLLNEIIFDIDKLITQEQFLCLEKIKTIGSTYMAASGLTPYNLARVKNEIFREEKNSETAFNSTTNLSRSDISHLCILAHFALLIKHLIDDINLHTANDLKVRIGMAFGPVVAGVIGAKTPQYDIWGKSVNLASRMDSTGVNNQIQVPEEMYQVLKERGFLFKYRSITQVKGIGQVPTYFLTGCTAEAAKRIGVSRVLLQIIGGVSTEDEHQAESSLSQLVLRLVQKKNRKQRYDTVTNWPVEDQEPT